MGCNGLFMVSLIQHVWVDGAFDAAEFLVHKFSVTEIESQHLIQIGAVYRNKKRLVASSPLFSGDYLRVHLNPKRFQVPLPLSKFLIFENEDYAVLNKPRGVPIHATVDNAVENAIAQLTREKGIPFFVTHRLDVETEGLVILAKNKTFQKQFNEKLLQRKVRKQYIAVTEQKIEPGRYLHYQKPSERAPKEIVSEFRKDYLACDLKILSSEAKENNFFETKIELITGRTHQIRCQLAFLGSPLVGDSLYGSRFPGPYQLKATSLSFDLFSHTI
jgi:23S rRNA pseudouridine1911/1915/1917 synthase